MFFDSDDELLPYALEKLVGALQDHPEAGVAYGGFYMVHADGRPATALMMPVLNPHASHPGPDPDRNAVAYGLNDEGQILSSLLQYDAMLMGATLQRTAVVRRVGGFDTDIHMEHLEFFLRLAYGGVSFAPVHVPVVRIRRHDGNISGDLIVHEQMLQTRLSLIDRYLPVGDGHANKIRRTARHNALFMHGLCLMALGGAERGLAYVGQAVSQQLPPPDVYDAFAELACTEALAKATPLDEIHRVLRALGSAPHTRSLKYFVLSRFERIVARSRPEPEAPGRLQALRRNFSTGVNWGRSVCYLILALAFQPAVLGMYLRRLRRA